MPRFSAIRALFADRLPRLVLFDLDGTLIDSVPDIARAVNRTLARRGCAPVSEQNVRRWVGRGSRRLLRDAFAAASPCAIDDEALDKALAEYFATYLSDCTSATTLMPGAAELVGALNEAGVRVAVVTNKPGAITSTVLNHFALLKSLASVKGGDSGLPLKPAPDALLRIGADLEIEPDDALMVGDSQHDVQAARAAGMRVICVNGGYNHGEDIALANPDLVVPSLSALL